MKKFMLGLIVGVMLLAPSVYTLESKLSQTKEELSDTVHFMNGQFNKLKSEYSNFRCSIATYSTHK